jgi:hypothetical protein
MRKLIVAGVFLLVSLVATAQTPIVLDFELSASNYVPIGTAYSGLGITFNPNTQDLVIGPESWGIVGTNGPEFLAFNGFDPGYTMTMTFATPQSSISMDVSRSAGSIAGDTFTATIYDGATQVGTTTITFAAINTWTTVTLSAPRFTSITWTSAGVDFHPYGVDNIRLQAAVQAIPAVSVSGIGILALLLLALGLLALRR